MAIERGHRHAVAPRVTLPAEPALPWTRTILRRPAPRLAVADERSVGDVRELEMPREAMCHGLDPRNNITLPGDTRDAERLAPGTDDGGEPVAGTTEGSAD
jgi:hypothetical protein